MTGWRINIMTAEESATKQASESDHVRKLFIGSSMWTPKSPTS